MMAAKQGETSLVQILVGADEVDVNIQDNVSVCMCSLLIIILALSEFIQSLEEGGSLCSGMLLSWLWLVVFQTVGWSALFYAAKDSHMDITRLLIGAGANVLLKDRVWNMQSFSLFRLW